MIPASSASLAAGQHGAPRHALARPAILVPVASVLGVATAILLDHTALAGAILLGLGALISVPLVWGLRGVVVPFIVISMLPLPFVTIRSASFGVATFAAPTILAAGLMVARQRRKQVSIPYVPLYVVFMSFAALSVAHSWLYWDPNVATGLNRGFGHRWIGYQLAALFFLATPFLAFAAGLVYGHLEKLRFVYYGVLASVTITTLVGLWTWWHNPVNPLVTYLSGTRPNINPDATVFLIVLAGALLVWTRDRRERALAVILLALGLLAAYLSYALNAWFGALGALTVIAWARWRWRGLAAWLAGLGALALVFQTLLVTIVSQRLASGDLDRIGLWHSALIVWSKSPFVGVGSGNLPSYMETYSIFSIKLVLQGYQEAHNVFLELLAEIGAVGLALFLVFLGLVIVRLVRQLRDVTRYDPHFRSAALGFVMAGAIMAFVGSGLVPTIGSAGWEATAPVLVTWFCAGCAASLSRSHGVAPA